MRLYMSVEFIKPGGHRRVFLAVYTTRMLIDGLIKFEIVFDRIIESSTLRILRSERHKHIFYRCMLKLSGLPNAEYFAAADAQNNAAL